ncbi:hypothetical protein [Treponema sp.]|uniref:hypothetical protein n=1 Tax=Treponema sp. TaxID=166 RepID=UPI003F0ACA0D
MSFFQALFFLYLLFPVLNEDQLLISSMLKGNLGTKQAALLKSKVEFFLNENSVSAFYSENFKNNGSELYLSDSQGRMILFKYDQEFLSVSENANGAFSCVSVNQDEFSRVEYNCDYRPVEKIIWKNADTVSDLKILMKENWSYSGDDIFSFREDFENKKCYEIRYNDDFLPVCVFEFSMPSENDSDGKKQLVKKSFFSYDSEKRIISDEEIFYDEKIPEKEIYKKKSLYSYTQKSSSADFKFYENDVLRFSVVYSSDDDFEETVYFPGGGSIVKRFKNGEKIN